MNSRIITLGKGKPVTAVIGLVHGNEECGGKALDSLKSSSPKSTLKLVYANLEAASKGLECVDSNLNRVFPGKKDGNLEERTAYDLREHLRDCDYVLDIHSTSYPTEPFAISTKDSNEFSELASLTGLKKYVILTSELAHGKALIDYVNSCGGKGISFEAGEHSQEKTNQTARSTAENFLKNLRVLEGEGKESVPEKYHAFKVIAIKSMDLKLKPIENFRHYPKGTVYGEDKGRKLVLEQDCCLIVLTSRPGELVMLAAKKE